MRTASHPHARPPRPLGLTVALVATAILYGVLPLLEVYFLWRLNMAASEAYILGGVDITVWNWIEGGLGVVMLAVCVLAWWGRPARIRWVLMALLVVITVTNLYRIGEAWRSSINPIFDGQAQEVLRNFLRCQFPALVVVPLYVLWYINRAPARAFYRRRPPAENHARSATLRTGSRNDQ